MFERASDRYVPSAAGIALLQRAQAIGADVSAAERAIQAFQEQVAGVVRVSAPDWLVTRVLAGVVRQLVDEHPAVRIELASEAGLASLHAGHADIALRARRFELPGTWQRAVGRVEFGLFASRKYVNRHGAHVDPPAVGHRVVSMDDREGPIADVEWLKRVAKGASEVARANGRDALCHLIREGCGIGCLPLLVGDAEPQLVRVEGLGVAPVRRLFLGVHRDQRSLPRIRRVYEATVRALKRAVPLHA